MTTDARKFASRDREGRASRLGPRVYLAAAAAALLIAAVVVLAIRPASSSGPASVGLPYKKVTKYGDVPKQLTIAEPTPVKLATATPSKPDLQAMEGYPVNARLSGGAAQVFMEGPAVPNWARTEAGDGTLKAGQTVPATFTATFADTSGTVPLSAADFSIVTYSGQVLHPKITTSTGGSMPTTLPVGQKLTLKLSVTGVPEGDGAIRWAPVNKRILVSYFWTLELD